MLALGDKNKDGVLDKEEFIVMMMKMVKPQGFPEQDEKTETVAEVTEVDATRDDADVKRSVTEVESIQGDEEREELLIIDLVLEGDYDIFMSDGKKRESLLSDLALSLRVQRTLLHLGRVEAGSIRAEMVLSKPIITEQNQDPDQDIDLYVLQGKVEALKGSTIGGYPCQDITTRIETNSIPKVDLDQILPRTRQSYARALFKRYDKDNNKRLTVSEFTMVLQRLEPEVSETSVLETFLKVGATGRSIDLIQLCMWLNDMFEGSQDEDFEEGMDLLIGEDLSRNPSRNLSRNPSKSPSKSPSPSPSKSPSKEESPCKEASISEDMVDVDVGSQEDPVEMGQEEKEERVEKMSKMVLEIQSETISRDIEGLREDLGTREAEETEKIKKGERRVAENEAQMNLLRTRLAYLEHRAAEEEKKLKLMKGGEASGNQNRAVVETVEDKERRGRLTTWDSSTFLRKKPKMSHLPGHMKHSMDVVVELALDFTCPWSYIAFKRLMAALERLPKAYANKIGIISRPFLLNPEVPMEATRTASFHVTHAFGPAQAARFGRNGTLLNKQAEEMKLFLNKDRVISNTMMAHRLAAFGIEKHQATNTIESIFRANIEGGEDLNLISTLSACASVAGLHSKEVEHYLSTNEGVESVQASDHDIKSTGLTGIPAYFIWPTGYRNGRELPMGSFLNTAVSWPLFVHGNHEKELLVNLFRDAIEEIDPEIKNLLPLPVSDKVAENGQRPSFLLPRPSFLLK